MKGLFADMSETGSILEYLAGKYLASLLLICAAAFFWLYCQKGKKKVNLPPGPRGLPFLGYYPFLGSESYRKLHELRKLYGSVFGLFLGKTYVVFLGDYNAVKEAFSKTTDRPEGSFNIIPDGIGFASLNGEEWNEQRTYCMRAMSDLGLGSSSWEQLVQEEVADFVKKLKTQNGRPFDISKLLIASITNNVASLVFGRRIPMDEQTVVLLNRFMGSFLSSIPVIGLGKYFPFLYDIVSRLKLSKNTEIKDVLVEFNHYVRDQVNHHKKRSSEVNPDNFIEGYLLEIKKNEENKLNNTYHYTNLYGNIQALFIGASDTTRTSLNWLFIIMAGSQDIQEKVHAEIDAVLGRDDHIQWSDRASLPYTFAVIMESQRWMTIAPLDNARVATEDLNISGYDIPKGTEIIANFWGLHHDSKYWKEPEKFQPERLLSADEKQVNMIPESYVPFSYGKRSCPGETIARMEILFYFVALMQKFRVLLPAGKVPKFQGVFGLVYQPVPQELCYIPRE